MAKDIPGTHHVQTGETDSVSPILSASAEVFFRAPLLLPSARASDERSEALSGCSDWSFWIWSSDSLSRMPRFVYNRVKPLSGRDPGHRARRLSLIVGRDTAVLEREEIVRATVETVAENTSDGIVAPLFFVLLGGAPLGMTYKAINTLDSMVGYKNERYLQLGWASARCDDLANYLPARLTGLLLMVSAVVLQKDWKNSWMTMMRDARKHASPNSGYPESAVAGALKVRLGGTNYYNGIPRKTAFLGHQGAPLDEASIGDVVKMMYCSSFIMLTLSLLILWRVT